MKRKGIFIGCLLILLLIYSRQAAQNKLLQKEGATMDNAKITIAFPLRGEWYTETSPADRVPSHGTDRFGLRYAFDFIQKDRESSSHTGQTADYFLGGIPLEKYYCFGQPIYAPFAGEIIIVENNTNDGENASWIHDQTKAIRHSLFSIQSETALKPLQVIMSSSNNPRVFMRPSAIYRKTRSQSQQAVQSNKARISATLDIPAIRLSLIYIFN